MRRFFAILSLCIMLALAGCSSNSTEGPSDTGNTSESGNASEPKRGGVLRIVDEAPSSPFGLPWEIVSTGINSGIPALEPLLWLDWTGTKITPKLAERWEVASDRSSITLFLRKGVKFHDGTDFNAEAVRFNLDKQIKEKLIPGIESVEVLDSHTVKLNLEEWDNAIFTYLGSTPSVMVSPSAIQEHGEEWARYHPVGTGPFQFVSYQRDASIKYKRFEDYWDEGKPYLDEVEIIYLKDPNTFKAAFLAKQVDMGGMAINESIADLLKAGYPARVGQAGRQLVVLWPDSADENSPFAKREVRLALSHAIDRNRLAEVAGFGTGIPAYQIAFPDTPAHIQNYEPHAYDVNRAKQLLNKAGYGDGFTTKLILSPYLIRDVAVIVQEFLSEIGIRAEIETPDFARYREYQKSGWTGLILGTMGYYPNYSRQVQAYFMGGNQAYSDVKSPNNIADLWGQMRSTEVEEPEVVQSANRFLSEDLVVIPLYSHSRVYVMHEYVHDTNHLSGAAWPWWTPAEAWVDKMN